MKTQTLCLILCGALVATGSAQDTNTLFGGRPLPADLQLFDSGTPPSGVSVVSLAHPEQPPHPNWWLAKYLDLNPGITVPLYFSATLTAQGIDRLYADDRNINYDDVAEDLAALAAVQQALAGGGNMNILVPDASGPETPDYSTNATDLWLSITNLGSFYGASSCITTSTIVFHNTRAGLFYKLLFATTLDPAVCTWSTFYDGLLDDGGIITLTNVVWTNAPTPAFWTNSDGTCSNQLATIYFRGMMYAPGTGPSTGGQLLVLVDGSAGFYPRVNGSSLSPSPNATTSSQRLYTLNPPIYKLNLGYNTNDDYWPSYLKMADGSPDGEDSSSENLGGQNAIAIIGLKECTSLTNLYVSRNHLTSLDLSGITNLVDVESYAQTTLTNISLAGCSGLRRVCLESNAVSGQVDATGCTAVTDFRAALNYLVNPTASFTNVVFPAASAQNIYHLCMRDEPQLNPNFLASNLTNFTTLEQLIFWNAGQIGAVTLASTNLVWVQVYNNQLTDIRFTNCASFYNLLAYGNNLTTNALDRILGELRTNSPNLQVLDLTCCGWASTNGYANFYNLTNRVNTICHMDIPDTNNVAGSNNAITFVTMSTNSGGYFTHHLEVSTWTNANITWHWGDGTTITTNATYSGSSHYFTTPSWRQYRTNWVSIDPPWALASFGEHDNDGLGSIHTVMNLNAFTNLNELDLWSDGLQNLDIAQCHSLRFVYIGGAPDSRRMDQWLNDLHTAVPGSVSTNSFVYYDTPQYQPMSGVTSDSANARAMLQQNHWQLLTWQ